MRCSALLAMLVVIAAACDTGRQLALTKDEARAQYQAGQAQGDLCAEYEWYGDGVCDDFCPHPDSDCATCSSACFLYCENGFKKDDRGCDLCECAEPQQCWGAWRDENGVCRSPSDGVYPDECCQGPQQCFGAWRDENGSCRSPNDGAYPEECCCPKIVCELGCANFKKDSNGCGVCACDETPVFCGGLANIPCPDGMRCIDDPTDDCDPANNNYDCAGMCVSTCHSDTGGPCAAGQACVPDPWVNCGPDTNCVGAGLCLPAGDCLSDSDCRTFSDYFTTCSCIALGPGVPSPDTSGTPICLTYCELCQGATARCDTATRTCMVQGSYCG
jgi:hypothetical protein